MSEWKTIRLREICDSVDYGLTASASTEPVGPKFLRITDIVRPTFDWGTVPYVSVEPSRKEKYLLQHGDIVIARTGATTGESKWIDSPPDAVFASYLVRLKISKDVDSRFIGYVLKSDQFLAYVRAVVGDKSAQPNASATTLTNARIRIPTARSMQRAIAAVLGALDDKIAVNERIVRTSDELRRLLFANFLAIRAECTEERPLTWFAEFINGRAFTKGATGTGRMVVRIAELNSGPGGSTVYNDIDVPDRHLARPGDVLFAWSGSLTVARWYREEAIINQHIFKVIPKRGVPVWLAYELVLSKLATFKSIAADKATTMGHIQRHHLEEPVVAPTADVIPSLHQELGPLWDRALAAEQESLALARLRDELLPGLMSGAIRVRDAEKIAEDVT